jgi:hypothetical protein
MVSDEPQVYYHIPGKDARGNFEFFQLFFAARFSPSIPGIFSYNLPTPPPRSAVKPPQPLASQRFQAIFIFLSNKAETSP